jgi:hypothetical protein
MRWRCYPKPKGRGSALLLQSHWRRRLLFQYENRFHFCSLFFCIIRDSSCMHRATVPSLFLCVQTDPIAAGHGNVACQNITYLLILFFYGARIMLYSLLTQEFCCLSYSSYAWPRCMHVLTMALTIIVERCLLGWSGSGQVVVL